MRQAVVDDLSEVADPVVLLVRADVECLAAYDLVGRIEEGQCRAGDVANVNERAPGGAVALKPDAPVVCAQATRLLRTMSSRRRGDTP